MRFSQSSHLLMFLSLETLTSILRTGLPTLVELIDLVSSDIIFLSQMTLLRWLTFLLASQSVILTVLLFWNFFSDASFYSSMASPPLGDFDHKSSSHRLVIIAKGFFKLPNLHMQITKESITSQKTWLSGL